MSLASHYLDRPSKSLGKKIHMSLSLHREAVEYLDTIRGSRTYSEVIEQLVFAEKARSAMRTITKETP